MAGHEIPLGKRTPLYRFFEILPALLSYGALILMVVLSLVNPLYAALYLFLIVITALVRGIGIAFRTIHGRNNADRAQRVDWRKRLEDLEQPEAALARLQERVPAKTDPSAFGHQTHIGNLQEVIARSGKHPKPSSVYNVVIIAAYNEDHEVIAPTIESVLKTTYDNEHLIVALAYEERGGEAIRKTARRLEKKYRNKFFAFHLIEHPADLPGEVVGKGGNITFAGRFLAKWLTGQKINHSNVIVTTLDSDNRPHKSYFDYVTYEYIIHEDRKRLSYQPIALFLNNIWDAPAPMRVVATGNSFWNVIVSMRPHLLRNFASHSQPLDALVEMDFWSTRTIVEDGHHYWRSYFHFKGDYSVTPIFVPIYQDAVLTNSYWQTLKAQFVQLRRWAYGASDIPYVATYLFTKKRQVPFFEGLARFLRLVDSHITLAVFAIMIAFGAWVPLVVNSQAVHSSIVAHQLPNTVSTIQTFALIGLFVTIFTSFKILPPRPERYKKHRTIFMLLQWFLMPVTAVVYSASAALNAQAHLALGKYLDKFDVTEKATADSVDRAKAERKQQKATAARQKRAADKKSN